MSCSTTKGGNSQCRGCFHGVVKKGAILGLMRLVADSYDNCSAMASMLAEGAVNLHGAGALESASRAVFTNEGKISSIVWFGEDTGWFKATIDLDGLAAPLSVRDMSIGMDASLPVTIINDGLRMQVENCVC